MSFFDLWLLNTNMANEIVICYEYFTHNPVQIVYFIYRPEIQDTYSSQCSILTNMFLVFAKNVLVMYIAELLRMLP
jgi:hypothetical protein